MNNDDFKILGERSFEEMNLPPILYKYRDWGNENHRRILTHNELFLAPPKSFEDEFDCKIPIRYDLLTDKDIYEIYLTNSKKLNPYFKKKEHHEFAINWQSKGLLRNKKHLEDIDNEYFEEFNNHFGILSLTAISDNNEMWNRYAACKTGFCVGFKTIPLLSLEHYFGGGGEVSYFNELPIIKFNDTFEKKHHIQIFSKLKKWEFEREYRLTKYKIQNRRIRIPSGTYTVIIIGEKASCQTQNEILEICNCRFDNIKIYKACTCNQFKTIKPLIK